MYILCALANIQFNATDPYIFKSDKSSMCKEVLEGFTLEPPIKEDGMLLNYDFMLEIGLIELREYKKNWYIGTRYDMSNIDYSEEDYLIYEKGTRVITALELWLLALWLVKDHSTNITKLYTHIYRNGDSSTLALKKDYLNFMANGIHENVEVNSEEIERVHDWLKFVENHLLTKSKGTEKLNAENLIKNNSVFDYGNLDEIYKKNNSISRALLFIMAARVQNFLPAKVANYISAIEALVTSEKSFLKKQASERTAMIIGKDKLDKIQIRDSVRDAYNARSSYVHGDTLKKDNKNLKDISVITDELVRRLIKKVALDHSEIAQLRGKALTKWFEEKY